jgi:uncharacterized protein with HEPN domain
MSSLYNDPELLLEVLNQMLVAARRIERRFAGIQDPDDFLRDDEGLDRLDSIGMMVIAIGESVKQLDRITSEQFLRNYPEVDWKGAKGARDILSHHYFDLNAEVLYNVCRDHIPLLIKTIERMKSDLAADFGPS